MSVQEQLLREEHLERTCLLDSEYIGPMSFALEAADRDFAWRKGKRTAEAWLRVHAARLPKLWEQRERRASAAAGEHQLEPPQLLDA